MCFGIVSQNVDDCRLFSVFYIVFVRRGCMFLMVMFFSRCLRFSVFVQVFSLFFCDVCWLIFEFVLKMLSNPREGSCGEDMFWEDEKKHAHLKKIQK